MTFWRTSLFKIYGIRFRPLTLARNQLPSHQFAGYKMKGRLLHTTPVFRSGQSPVDKIIDEIAEQYAIAKDEFEIAYEETEKNTVYAAEDREVAREELKKLVDMYDAAVEGEGGEEVKKRVGQRVREIKNAVERLKDED
ncbi:hypothetical protein EX30DRAFT_345625 [Ascodesmis nigricans]|uniref:Uncharacterized protein n=1 Tax=Ascodesmis nigricans TaxID=341454 RepID=A0A4S2N6P7_9PEZI|nr:hypothetical protein EX30DRAFT_345625 [Ascodesmis nigricans]